MSNFYIYNQAKQRIGILQYEESVQWLENYQSPGEVKVVARVSEENLALLVDGNRIYNTDSTAVGIISQVEIDENVGQSQIVARAELSAQLLAQRVSMGTHQIGNVEQGMYALYQNNRRNLPIDTAARRGYTQTTTTQVSWKPVLEAILELAEESGLGFRVNFDPETGKEVFEVYQGVDRSQDNSPNYVGYFGTDVGNLYNVQSASSSSDFKNAAIVTGEGEDEHKIKRIVSVGNVQGEARRELYVDRKDLKRKYQTATQTGWDNNNNPVYSYTDGAYTDAEYNALLDEAGYQALGEHLHEFTLKCDVSQDNMKYGEDYFLGDRVPIKVPEYGIFASAIISSVNMVYELSGMTVNITLSHFEVR